MRSSNGQKADGEGQRKEKVNEEAHEKSVAKPQSKQIVTLAEKQMRTLKAVKFTSAPEKIHCLSGYFGQSYGLLLSECKA